jgi:hypothetical protein
MRTEFCKWRLITAGAILDEPSRSQFMKRFAVGFATCVVVPLSLSAQVTAPTGVLPVVGSTRGAFNSLFKTELQLNNRSASVVRGRMVYRAQGEVGTAQNIVLPYELLPHETKYYEDVVAALGQSGLGSMDFYATEGQLPTAVARAYNDGGEEGTTGATVRLVRSTRALRVGDAVSLLVPADLHSFRFNIGARALGDGARIRVLVRGENGIVRHTSAETTMAPNLFQQRTGDAFAGVQLLSNESVGIEVLEGAVVVYGTSIDNRTNDSSIQIGSANEQD